MYGGLLFGFFECVVGGCWVVVVGGNIHIMFNVHNMFNDLVFTI